MKAKKIKKKKVGIGIAIFLAICCIIGCPKSSEDKVNISTTESTVTTTIVTTLPPSERQTTTTQVVSTSKPKSKSKPAAQSKAATTIKVKEAPAQEKSNKNDIVYITNTGDRYHRAGCRFLESKAPINREDAINRGYTPCKTCKPDS